MIKFLILKNTFLPNLFYKKLESSNIEHAHCECISKKLNIMYAIEENGNFIYYGSTLSDDIQINKSDYKKSFTILFDLFDSKNIMKKFFKNKYENLILLHGNHKNLKISYDDIYPKIFEKFDKNENVCIYMTKYDKTLPIITNYIFDIIIINDDDFEHRMQTIMSYHIKSLKMICINMNYFYFFKDQSKSIFNLENCPISLKNVEKYKNFMIIPMDNLKSLKTTTFKKVDFIYVSKIY